MRNRQAVTIFVFLLPVLLYACASAYTDRPTPRAVNGVLDLSDWDFERDGPVKLNGEWEFYWKQLLDARDFERSVKGAARSVEVPAYWNSYTIENGPVDGRGYGTFRLRLLLPEGQDRLGLRIPSPGTAYSLAAGDQLFAKAGVPGSSAAASRSELRVDYAGFEHQGRAELVLQVANYQHWRGGIWRPIHLGLERQTRQMQIRAVGFELFLGGAILMMALYHCALFLFRRKDAATFWFALFCLLIVFRLFVMGERLIQNLAPDLAFDLIFAEYLSFYIAVPVFILFTSRIFPESFPRLAIALVLAFCGVFSAIVLFAPAHLYTQTRHAYEAATVLIGVYILAIVVRAAVRGSFVEAGIFLFGFSVIFVAFVFNIVMNEVGRSFPFVFPSGVFLFVLTQSVVLSRRFAVDIRLAEEASQHLERRVEAQTEDLRQARDEVLKLNEFMLLMNKTKSHSDMLDLVFAYIQSAFHVEVIWLLRIDAESNELYTSRAFHAHWREGSGSRAFAENFRAKISPELGGFYQVIEKKRPLYITRSPRDPGRAAEESVRLVDLNSILYMPLLLGERVIGVVSITNHSTPLDLSEAQIDSIDRFCQQIAGALYQASLRAEVAEVRAEIQNQKLEAFGKVLKEATDLSASSAALFSYLEREFALDAAWLLLVDRDSRELYCAAHAFAPEARSDMDPDGARRFADNFREELTPELGTLYRTYALRKTVYIPSVRPDAKMSDVDRSIVEAMNLTESIQFPLVNQGETIGIVVCTRSRRPRRLPAEKIRSIARFCEHFAGSLVRHTARKEKHERNQGDSRSGTEPLPGNDPGTKNSRRARSNLLQQLYRSLY